MSDKFLIAFTVFSTSSFVILYVLLMVYLVTGGFPKHTNEDNYPHPSFKPLMPQSEQHCFLCNDGKDNLDFIPKINITNSERHLIFSYYAEVKYCPICGRKLKQKK